MKDSRTMTKTCSRCQASKSTDEFAARTSAKDGKSSYCRTCQSEYHAAWRKENRKPSGRVRAEQPGKKCKTCGVRKVFADFPRNRSMSDGLNSSCKPCKNERNRAYRAANPDAVKDTKRRCYEKNADVVRTKQKAYADANRDLVREKNRLYARNNPEVMRAHGGARRSRRIVQSLPLTAEQQSEIVAVYAEAIHLTKVTGVAHVVDHHVPLKGKLVCGLHVPWNLRVITQKDNNEKYNNLSPDVENTEEVRANLAAWQAEKFYTMTR